jgi:hypothetical protein
MILHATRDHFTPTLTVSTLRVEYDGALAYDGNGWSPNRHEGPLDFGHGCEDVDRGLDAAIPATWRRKVKTQTAIPVGRYRVRITHSPKYKRLMMRVLEVPAYSGVLIHQGNSAEHSAGCYLPGLVRGGPGVLESARAVAWLFDRVRECEARGEAVWLVVGRDPAAWAGFLAAGGADGQTGRAA